MANDSPSKYSRQRGATHGDSRAATMNARARASSGNGMAIPVSRAGAGRSASSASTITPSVPSLPTNQSTASCAGRYPAVFFSTRGRRTVTVSPLASTTVSARTWARVAPYRSVRGPEALHATAPPIVHSSSLVGSGAKNSPCGAGRAAGRRAARRARLARCAPWHRQSMIRSSARVDSRMPRSEIDAPVVLVCDPAAVTARGRGWRHG